MYKQICRAYKVEEEKEWEPSEDLTNKVIRIAKAGQMLSAVKTLKESSENNPMRWGLKESKDMVDFLRNRGFI